jgi:molecular chaperone GrpE
VSNEGVENPAETGPEQVDSTELQDPAAALAAVTQERDQLQDRLLRTQAEFQNLRRRAEKEKLEFVEYASSEAVGALLPILDDFERALLVESSDAEYAKGMALIYQRFYDALKKLGLEPIDSVGKPFNPHIHHAVEKQETTEAEPDTVLAEYQRAYNFKGRLLRAAMVKVAVEPKSEG